MSKKIAYKLIWDCFRALKTRSNHFTLENGKIIRNSTAQLLIQLINLFPSVTSSLTEKPHLDKSTLNLTIIQRQDKECAGSMFVCFLIGMFVFAEWGNWIAKSIYHNWALPVAVMDLINKATNRCWGLVTGTDSSLVPNSVGDAVKDRKRTLQDRSIDSRM